MLSTQQLLFRPPFPSPSLFVPSILPHPEPSPASKDQVASKSGRDPALGKKHSSQVEGESGAPSVSRTLEAGEGGQRQEGCWEGEGPRRAKAEAAERRPRVAQIWSSSFSTISQGATRQRPRWVWAPYEPGAGEGASGVRGCPPRESLPPSVGPFDLPVSATPEALTVHSPIWSNGCPLAPPPAPSGATGQPHRVVGLLELREPAEMLGQCSRALHRAHPNASGPEQTGWGSGLPQGACSLTALKLVFLRCPRDGPWDL